MATQTQYSPDADLDNVLLNAGASKTVYALVTPETEQARIDTLQGDQYIEGFRDAWTKKQDTAHEGFFETWRLWAAPVVDFDQSQFPFYYPTAGASEALRQLIFHPSVNRIHYFAGEYEGFRAYAEAAAKPLFIHLQDEWNLASSFMSRGDLFFISAPSAIDGNVWKDFNAFLATMPPKSVVVDLTYVGSIPSIAARLQVSQTSVHSVVFSLSKPFGVYYDRIGGVWSRDQDLGLFGNKWFKNLTSLKLGTTLMARHGVFELPTKYHLDQRSAAYFVNGGLRGQDSLLIPSDVVILAHYPVPPTEHQTPLDRYLRRGNTCRVCLTPCMAEDIGTSGPVEQRAAG